LLLKVAASLLSYGEPAAEPVETAAAAAMLFELLIIL
jgi:hypothetical protein